MAAAAASDTVQALEAQLRSVQRNYDNLSSVLQAKQLDADQLEACWDEERAAAASLAKQLQQALQRCEHADAQLQEMQRYPAEIEALQADLTERRFAESLAATRAASLTASLQQVQQDADRINAQSAQLRRELAAAIQQTARAQSDVKDQKAAVQLLRQERSALAADVASAQVRLHDSQAHAAALQRRCQVAEAEALQQEECARSAEEQCQRLRNAAEEAHMSQTAAETALYASQSQQQLLQSQLHSSARILTVEQDKARAAQDKVASLASSLEDAHQKSHHAGKWQHDVVDLELRVCCIDDMLRTLGMLCKAAWTQRKQVKAHSMNSVSLLEHGLAIAQDELAAEQRAHAATQQELQQLQQDSQAQLQAAAARLQRENEAERQRLKGKLGTVQEEMRRLRSCWEADQAAAVRLRDSELQQNAELRRQLDEVRAQRDQCRAVLCLLDADVAAMADRLAQAERAMDVQSAAIASGERETATADDGELSTAVERLRLRFTVLAQQMQRVADAKVKQANARPALSEQEQQLRATVSKLVHVEAAQEGLYTCMVCMAIFKHPVTCQPCGHTYCQACLLRSGTPDNPVCVECNGAKVDTWVENMALDGLCSKHGAQATCSFAQLRPHTKGCSWGCMLLPLCS
ncbi:hypothetical protein WJX72_007872 [[Myrmecia] bisecta]|uniref:RING-type domain-containing protein n=1 Tax=[Myrmecia] bisecta TaxID=41462 RepID=A0AAW1QRK7_9CHLO